MSDQTAVSISVKWCPVHSLVLLCLYLDGLFFEEIWIWTFVGALGYADDVTLIVPPMQS